MTWNRICCFLPLQQPFKKVYHVIIDIERKGWNYLWVVHARFAVKKISVKIT